MLICDHCESIFEDDECKTEYEEYGASYNVCPYCGSDNISKAFRCKICEENKNSTLSSFYDDEICKDCFSDTLKEWQNVSSTSFCGEKLSLVMNLFAEFWEV